MKIGVSLALFIALLFNLIPDTLLRIFIDDPEIIKMGRPLLRLGAIYQLTDAVYIITEGSLRGAGDTRWPFIVEFALGWGLLLPAGYTLGVVLEGGLMGAWVGATIYAIVLSTMFIRRFHSGAWKKIQI